MNARQKLVHTFSVDYYSDQDECRYSGSFTIKKMSAREIGQLGVKKAQLNGGLHFDASKPGAGIDEYTDDFNQMLAQFTICIRSAPEWWDLDSITDVRLLNIVYREVLEHEGRFLGRNRPDTTEGDELGSGSTGNSSSTPESPNTDGSPRKVVSSEVQSALEP